MLLIATTTTAAPPPASEEQQTRILKARQEECWRRIEEDAAERLELHGRLHGHANTHTHQHALDISCPPLWDGILCWPRTPAGHLASQSCPAYVAGFRKQENATKLCTDTGIWFSRQSDQSWTNFSQCYSGPKATVIIDMESPKTNESHHYEPFLPTLKVISEVGYAVSLLSLLVAFFILASIKRLRCPRNVLHMHLFASFIMRAAMSLLKDSLFVKGLGMMADLLTRDGDVVYFNSEHQVNWLCRMIVSLWQYFIMANYLWILMEGLYLHNLIFLALFSDSSSITLYVTLGWGVPAMFVLPWTVCRALWENNLCWTTNDITTIFLLIRVPTTTSIVVNFCLFMNIVRVLFLKLKSSACEETKTYRRWAKSTLVLVPLFGVHYMLFLGLHFSSNHTVEIVWLFCDQLFASFNGFFVALLYCFLNGEVKSELSKKWSVAELLEAAERWRCTAVGAGGATADDDEEGALANGSARDAACACAGDGHRKGKRGRRHRRPRGSCYSSTSFTTVSVLPPGHCCNPGKRRPQGSALSPSTPPPQPSPSPSRLAVQRRADAIDTAANSDTDSPEISPNICRNKGYDILCNEDNPKRK